MYKIDHLANKKKSGISCAKTGSKTGFLGLATGSPIVHMAFMQNKVEKIFQGIFKMIGNFKRRSNLPHSTVLSPILMSLKLH